MAEEDSILHLQMKAQSAIIFERTAASKRAGKRANGSEPALKCVTVWQDSLTRHWAAELWDQAGQLIGHGSVCLKLWDLNELRKTPVFPQAVRAAAGADVLVISIRDAGELPLFLRVWIDAWIPRRARRHGTLVALIGVPAERGAQSGSAYQYLKEVARRAGLDFLSRERRLPEQPVGRSARPGIMPTANLMAA